MPRKLRQCWTLALFRWCSSAKIDFNISGFQAEYAVSECRQALPDGLLIMRIHARNNDTRAARQAIKHNAPRVNDHRVAVGLATVHVKATLRWCDHVGKAFDGASADQ